MQAFSDDHKIALIKSIFKAREDVFALRWEKGNKSGYMPAYTYDPYMYRLHKQRGGNFKDYKDKDYLKLEDYQIVKHLNGKQFIGIYPLLQDNTSWFIVADFDKKGWEEQSQRAIAICKEHSIFAYLERSRSGNGGHIWIFFDAPYPAVKSRKVVLNLFENAEIFSAFDKNTSFDRLFPNQDYLSKKGFGNLIALPFQGGAMAEGNSCFVNPETLQPYLEQWEFLREVKRTPTTLFDSLLETYSADSNSEPQNTSPSLINITLKNSVVIKRDGLIPEVITFLKEGLNFFNSDYVIKKKIGKSNWDTERYFNLIEERENSIEIPRGMTGKLIRFCNQQSINYSFYDERKLLDTIDITSSIQLMVHQKAPLEATLKKDLGIIVAPPGSGKTIIGLKIIEQKKQPALIITHRQQIAQQWIERIEAFFGIPKMEIGKIGQGKFKIGKQITVCLIQSLGKVLKENSKDVSCRFGTVIIDECHHIPAKSFREVIHCLSPFYQYGLTATPFRKSSDERLLFVHLGTIISEIKPAQIEKFKKGRIIVRDTNLNLPFNSKTDRFETLSKVLIHDSERNSLIIKDITKEIKGGRKIVVITERKEHIQILYQYLKQSYEIVTISGEDTKNDQEIKWKQIQEGNYQGIITTGQYFGEGTDIQDASCLFLVYPFAFKGKLIQYIGRVQRSELTPIIYDYRDVHINYLEKLFLKRNVYYRNLDRQATLFEDIPKETSNNVKSIKVDKLIQIPINELSFHYGMICFSYKSSQFNDLFEFEIENEEIQPEFEVLKPYFIKVLGTSNIHVHIKIEIENGVIVSQLAESVQIDKINKEVIDSVKFRFVNQFINNTGSIIQKELTGDSEESIIKSFGSENDLLESLLNNKTYEHSNELYYLSRNHCYEILKIRFVLNPFSFVFLLKGNEQFHVILETLDTKEATYMWHISRKAMEFNIGLERVNQDLNIIRNEGRLIFLEGNPLNFSRIIHDYKDSKKSFYKWKNALEERLL